RQSSRNRAERRAPPRDRRSRILILPSTAPPRTFDRTRRLLSALIAEPRVDDVHQWAPGDVSPEIAKEERQGALGIGCRVVDRAMRAHDEVGRRPER